MRDNLKWVEGLPIIIGTGGKARWMPYGAGRAVAMDARLLGVLFWGAVAAAVYCLRPNAVLNRTDMEICGRREMLVMAGLTLATVLVCILPMSLSPYWNGEFPQHRNQYEVMAESLLNGHIYMDYDDIDPRLLEMDNPYDTMKRVELDVSVHWDHAFYNGRYYMYFGVVPVLLVFLPFRVITGTALLSYQGTQVFTALFIVGVFFLFRLLARKFFPSLTWGAYLSMSAAFSMMSVWYVAGTPALYCTAIASGICMEVWSLYFFARAVWDSSSETRATLWGVLGSLMGALAFGCRPPVALANLLAVPMLVHYVRGRRWDRRLLGQIAAVALPYLVVGAALMAYNYARFENPFEFGQSYQITVTDQSSYGNLLSRFDLCKVVNGLLSNFLLFNAVEPEFPYVSISSALINFPVCIFALFCLAQRDTLALMKARRFRSFIAILLLLPILITVSEVLMSPWLLERYRSDFYWLMGLLCFLSFGFFCQSAPETSRRRWCFVISLAALLTAFKSFLLWANPNDYNFTYCDPAYLDKFASILSLGLN